MRYCRSYVARMSVLLTCAAASIVVACGSGDKGANDTLPPIATTTTTTTLAPTTTTIPEFHVIQSGETLFQIAETYGLSYAELAAYNGITNPDDIQAGQKLKIPREGETTTSTIAVATSETSTTVIAP